MPKTLHQTRIRRSALSVIDAHDQKDTRNLLTSLKVSLGPEQPEF